MNIHEYVHEYVHENSAHHHWKMHLQFYRKPHMGVASAVRGSGKRPRCAWGGDSHTTGVVVKSLSPDGHGSVRRSTDALG